MSGQNKQDINILLSKIVVGVYMTEYKREQFILYYAPLMFKEHYFEHITSSLQTLRITMHKK